jgi:hypothetical protein
MFPSRLNVSALRIIQISLNYLRVYQINPQAVQGFLVRVSFVSADKILYFHFWQNIIDCSKSIPLLLRLNDAFKRSLQKRNMLSVFL